MRTKLLLVVLLMVTACDGGMQPLDAKKFLSEMDGPKVPTVNETLLENARSAERQGEWMTAGQIYEQILEKDPANAEIMTAMGECYRRIADYDRAIAMFNAALARDPAHLNAKEGKALALMGKGDFDTPAALFDEIMKVDAKRWKTLNALGILFTTRNLQTEAQQYFMEALKYSPSNTSILNNLGLSHALARQYDISIDTLMQAGALTTAAGGDRKRIDQNLGLVYAISGRLDDARMIAETYYTGAELNNNMGLYAHLAKNDQLARDYLNMAITQNKTFYEKAWRNLQDINNAGTSGSAAAQPVVLGEKASVTDIIDPAAETARPVPVAEKPKAKAKAKKTEKAPAPKVAAPKPAPAEKPAQMVMPEPPAPALASPSAARPAPKEDMEELPLFEEDPEMKTSEPGKSKDNISDIVGSTGE